MADITNTALIPQLRGAVEQMHNCKASWVEEIPVKEKFQDQTVWDGTVHIFELTGHPKATRAYAWSCPVPDVVAFTAYSLDVPKGNCQGAIVQIV